MNHEIFAIVPKWANQRMDRNFR